MIKKSELHAMRDAELGEEIIRLRKRLYELKSQAVTEKLENPRELGNIRRDIARILTETRARQLQETSP
jgi:large subunit ribosomal protein L29